MATTAEDCNYMALHLAQLFAFSHIADTGHSSLRRGGTVDRNRDATEYMRPDTGKAECRVVAADLSGYKFLGLPQQV